MFRFVTLLNTEMLQNKNETRKLAVAIGVTGLFCGLFCSIPINN